MQYPVCCLFDMQSVFCRIQVYIIALSQIKTCSAFPWGQIERLLLKVSSLPCVHDLLQ